MSQISANQALNLYRETHPDAPRDIDVVRVKHKGWIVVEMKESRVRGRYAERALAFISYQGEDVGIPVFGRSVAMMLFRAARPRDSELFEAYPAYFHEGDKQGWAIKSYNDELLAKIYQDGTIVTFIQ